MIKYIETFLTKDNQIYIGWWVDKKFQSKIFTNVKDSTKFYKELKAKEGKQNAA